MFVEEVRRPYKDKVYTAVLLRETYREGKKVKHRTLANLSALPKDVIEIIKRSLKGEAFYAAGDSFRITSSVSHGAAFCALKVAQELGLPKMLGNSWWRDLVLAMVIARVVSPGSKRFTREWVKLTSIPRYLKIPERLTVNSFYEAMDALLKKQADIETSLAKRHLREGCLVLYDLSSSYLEGNRCPLAEYGYSRDKKRGKKQFAYGLLTDQEGRPVSIQVFRGNASDTSTVLSQIDKLQRKFGFQKVVFCGDRGMITETRIDELKKAGYDWITALRAKAVQSLHAQGVIQLGLFDERNIAEIYDPKTPNERLIVCKNPMVAEERRRKREEMLQATETALKRVKERVEKGRLSRPEAIAMAVGRVIDRYKMAKHFSCTIKEGFFDFQRKEDSIAKEAALDGIYVLRTSVDPSELDAEGVSSGYKSLKHVERAFRTMKQGHLELRPVFHRLEDRVRAHAFLCMLAYYIQWHMERELVPLRAERPKEYGSFRLLLERLGSIQLHTVLIRGCSFEQVTEPGPFEQKILDRLGVRTLL